MSISTTVDTADSDAASAVEPARVACAGTPAEVAKPWDKRALTWITVALFVAL